jgi:hypothetical protein
MGGFFGRAKRYYKIMALKRPGRGFYEAKIFSLRLKFF